MSKKKKKDKKKEKFDIKDLEKSFKENSTQAIIEEYNRDNMAVFGANVNLKRYILEISDGLKPVARRIVYVMYLLKLYNSKSAKSATVTGEILSLFHPHGEQAVYKAIVYLAQEWRNNVTLVRGVGNFGSAYNPDSFAHQRYTNCALSEFAYDCYFSDWSSQNPEKDMTIDWIPNYDESRLEPAYLPAKYPLFLINWHKAMGVGRYTCTPGFNIKDAFMAVIKLIENPDAKFEIYPEDPKGCTLINQQDVKGMLDKESVKIKMRATYDVEHFKGKDIIEIKSVPFEVAPSTIIEAIRRMADKGELPEISDIGGSSEDDKRVGDGFSISIEVKKGYDPSSIMEKLYKRTQLEETFATKYAFVDEFTSVDYTLRIAILEWLRHRRETLIRIYKTKQLIGLKRIHFLEPLIKVIESGEIDKYVDIVRVSKKNEIVPKLMKAFGLTDYQASKITDVKISSLSYDSLQSYKDELKTLKKETKRLKEITRSKKLIDQIIIDQLNEGIEKYATPRKTKVVQILEALAVPDTLHYLIFTHKYVKKLPYDPDGYRIGRIDNGEKILKVLSVNNRDKIMMFTADGRCIPVNVSDIGNSSLQSAGIALSQYGAKDNLVNVIHVDKDSSSNTFVTVSEKGLITKTDIGDLIDKSKGFALMKLDKDDIMVDADICNETDEFLVYTKNGNGMKFKFKDFETTAKNSKGVQSMKLDDDDKVSGVTIIHPNDLYLMILTDRAYMKKLSIKSLPKTKRNTSPIEINSSGNISSIISIPDTRENVFIYTTSGAFDLALDNIKSSTRLGKPIRAIELKSSEYAFEVF